MSASETSLLLTYSKACFSTNITILIRENPWAKSSEPGLMCVASGFNMHTRRRNRNETEGAKG